MNIFDEKEKTKNFNLNQSKTIYDIVWLSSYY